MIPKTLFLAKDPHRISAPILHDHGPGVAPGVATALAVDLSIDMLVLSSYWARQRPPAGGSV